MRTWLSMASKFSIKSWADKARLEQTQYQRMQALTSAYRKIFERSDEAAQLVLADMHNVCGLQIPRDASATSTEQLWQEEGKRQVMLHILSFLDLSEADLRALENASRREAALTEMEQDPEGHDLS